MVFNNDMIEDFILFSGKAYDMCTHVPPFHKFHNVVFFFFLFSLSHNKKKRKEKGRDQSE